MTATMETGLWSIDEASYHRDVEHVSHSSLEVFRRSVEEYAGRFIHRTIPQPEQTAAMLLGSALHCLVLEPADFNSRYITPAERPPDCRTKAGKEWWKAFGLLAEGKRILTIDQSATVYGMAEGIQRNKIAAALIETLTHREQPIRWHCPWTGLPCKAKLDGCSHYSGRIIDLKTTNDPSPSAFARSVTNYGYYRQAAWYLDGARHAIGDMDWDWRFIAVRNESPYDCVVYDLDPQDIEHGCSQNETSMSQLLYRVEQDDWTGQWSQEIQRVRLPRYAYE